MKKKIIAIMLILTLALTALLACACDDNDGGNDGSVMLNENMSLEEAIEALKGVRSATITSTLYNADGWMSNRQEIRVTHKGLSSDTQLSGDRQTKAAVVFDDDIFYQFLLKEGEYKYSAQRATEDDVRNADFIPLDYTFSADSTMLAYLNNIDSVGNFVSWLLNMSIGGDGSISLPTSWQREYEYMIKDGILTLDIKMYVLNQLYAHSVMQVSDINTTELDIPEQYKDYKSLDLTV